MCPRIQSVLLSVPDVGTFKFIQITDNFFEEKVQRDMELYINMSPLFIFPLERFFFKLFYFFPSQTIRLC